jgi:cAMP-dependent protein kinase regulator
LESEGLEGIRVFANLDPADRAWIASRCQEVAVPIGTHLVKNGEQAYRFFGVLEGVAAVTREGHQVGVIEAGDIFGEMALPEDGPRNADVVAITPMRLATMMSWDFREALTTIPEVAKQINLVIEDRRRNSDQTLF